MGARPLASLLHRTDIRRADRPSPYWGESGTPVFFFWSGSLAFLESGSLLFFASGSLGFFASFASGSPCLVLVLLFFFASGSVLFFASFESGSAAFFASGSLCCAAASSASPNASAAAPPTTMEPTLVRNDRLPNVRSVTIWSSLRVRFESRALSDFSSLMASPRLLAFRLPVAEAALNHLRCG